MYKHSHVLLLQPLDCSEPESFHPKWLSSLVSMRGIKLNYDLPAAQIMARNGHHFHKSFRIISLVRQASDVRPEV